MTLVRKIGAGLGALLAALLVASCGGGGGSPGACMASAQTCADYAARHSGNGSGSTQSIAPPEQWANICTVDGEKEFTRSLLYEEYLWYTEMPSIQPSQVATVPDYFYSLLTPALDKFGQYKDRFSFIATTADADSLLTGSNVGYGVHWRQDASQRTRVAFVDAGSPAAQAGMARGGVLVNIVTPGGDWFPNGAASISFVYASAPGAATRTVTLSTAPVQEDPVPLVESLTTTGGRKVTYIEFNAHTTGAQDKLIPVIGAAQAAGTQDVVLDMRYNGGGYLYTAETLAAMLTGPAADGKVFEQLVFNDKLQPLAQDATFLFSGAVQTAESAFPAGTALPRLQLPRVYVLTTDNTCSASESVINSLRGVGVDVVLIGKNTCGKPYGFSRVDNCGWAYFAIEFQGVNAQGFGDYANGFAPNCAVPDDFDHALGDPSERMLAAALYHIDTGQCPAMAMSAPLRAQSFVPGMRQPMRGKIVLTSK